MYATSTRNNTDNRNNGLADSAEKSGSRGACMRVCYFIRAFPWCTGAAVESVGQLVRPSVCLSVRSESSSFPQPQHLWTVLKETSAIVKQMMIV